MNENIIISKTIINYIDKPKLKKDPIIISENIKKDIEKIRKKNNQVFILIIFFVSIDEWIDIVEFLKNHENIKYKGIIICPTPEVYLYNNYFNNIIDIRTTKISTIEYNFLIEKALFCLRKINFLCSEGFEIIKLKDTYHDQELLVTLGRNISTQKDQDEMLKIVLNLTMHITGADGGTIYFTEENENKKKILNFKKSYNFSKDLPYEKFTLDLNLDSIAGYVALTGKSLNIPDVYKISTNQFPSLMHNFKFDKKHNYKTISMLIVPIKNHLDHVVGILQLINSKENIKGPNWTGDEAFTVKLQTKEDFKKKVYPFDSRYESLVESIANQAGIALENIKMIKYIENQFDEFVKASVKAIESRDVSTSGHSFRIANLCIKIAKAISKESKGHLKDINFNEKQIKQLEYACLLHDFGKLNIDHNILLKAKKLYPKDYEFLQLKFDYLYKCLLLNNMQKKKDMLQTMKDGLNDKLEKIKEIKIIINMINEPNIAYEKAEKLFNKALKELSKFECYDLQGKKFDIIDDYEKLNLLTNSGSLNTKERKEIEKHVEYTYNFVSQIPWPPEFKDIPEITYKHHEFLDGSGYPQGLSGKNKIPLESRIITIADIFDALTAADRLYKKAITIPKALSILKDLSEKNKIDKDILDVFIKYKIYKA